MSKQVTIKPEEQFARGYADRLILNELAHLESAIKIGDLADKLSPAGLGLAAVRSLLATNPDRFAYHERRWIPASRLEAIGRPITEAVRVTLDRFGGPMALESLVQEVTRVLRREPEAAREAIERILDTNKLFVVTANGDAALAEWGFEAGPESRERAYVVNGITADDVAEVDKKLGKFDWREEGAVAKAIAKVAPVSLKALGGSAWNALNPEDPRGILLYDAATFLSEALSTEGFVYGSDGVIYPSAETKKWISTAVKLAEKLAPTIEVEDAAPMDVKPDDVKKMVGKIVASEDSITATKLLEEFYEITPGTRTFPDDLANLIAALREEQQVWWVGADRFRKAGSAPDYIYEAPEPFLFTQTEFREEDGELIDVELTDDGLNSSLRKLLQHPLATDVMDEDILPAPKSQPEQLRLVLKSIHRELGTFPVCQFPTGWLSEEPMVQELIFVDATGRELQVWLNMDARLMFGFIDWWYEQAIESGAVFTLTKTPKPSVFEFAWEDQTDPVVYISTQRMEELRQLQARSEELSTYDILREVMAHYAKGADFLTVLAEVNVVRRSSRRLIASLLSSYQCFYQRSGSPVWHYDAKKVELGFDKSKKKFIKK